MGRNEVTLGAGGPGRDRWRPWSLRDSSPLSRGPLALALARRPSLGGGDGLARRVPFSSVGSVSGARRHARPAGGAQRVTGGNGGARRGVRLERLAGARECPAAV